MDLGRATEEKAIDHAGHGDRRSDADSERDDDEGSEPWRASELSSRVAKILREVAEPAAAAGLISVVAFYHLAKSLYIWILWVFGFVYND